MGTQESGATKSIFRILTLLTHRWMRKDYTGSSFNDDTSDHGDGGCAEQNHQFAAPLLLETMKNVLRKFLESEKRDGHLIDANIWRNTKENGAKVALYCTTFATVVEDILEMILSLKPEQF